MLPGPSCHSWAADFIAADSHHFILGPVTCSHSALVTSTIPYDLFKVCTKQNNLCSRYLLLILLSQAADYRCCKMR